MEPLVLKLINLTPHAVDLLTVSGSLCIPPSGAVARVTVVDNPAQPIEVFGVLVNVVHSTVQRTVEGLPDRQAATWFIVSRLVAEAAGDRTDLVIPHGLMRDPSGIVIGCSRLARLITAPVADKPASPYPSSTGREQLDDSPLAPDNDHHRALGDSRTGSCG